MNKIKNTIADKRNTILVGFLGIDKHDIICYLSRILYHLGKKVLLVDCSESRALTESIPEPRMSERPDGGTEYNAIMEYRGVDFLNYGAYNAFILEALADQYKQESCYDYILIDFGFQTGQVAIGKCDILIFVSDQQIHNVKRLSLVPYHDKQSILVILKDFTGYGISEKSILREMHIDQKNCSTYHMKLNERNQEYKLSERYQAKALFSFMSEDVRSALLQIIKLLVPDTVTKETERAYRFAARGK